MMFSSSLPMLRPSAVTVLLNVQFRITIMCLNLSFIPSDRLAKPFNASLSEQPAS